MNLSEALVFHGCDGGSYVTIRLVSEKDISILLESARMEGAASHRALGRLMRFVDDADEEAAEIDDRIKDVVFKAARIGLTGPPGSGKSSLIASALESLVADGKKVGILAVDPTSPFTGGALLGDRVRLKGPTPENVFFRSLGSRGALGGISNSIWQLSRLLDWWGADIILIETVGSGQLGTSVGDVADVVVAVLTPEAGDGVQSMKAGVMELADCFIVNKCDRPGSELVFRELNLVRDEAEAVGRKVEVFMTSAIESIGIDEAVSGITGMWTAFRDSGELNKRRRNQVEREIAFRIEMKLRDKVMELTGGREVYMEVMEESVSRILSGEETVGKVVDELMGRE